MIKQTEKMIAQKINMNNQESIPGDNNSSNMEQIAD